LKSEASRALTEGKKNPPKIHGVELEVGKPKKKSNSLDTSSNATSNSEPSEGSLSSTPSSPIKHPFVPNVMHEISTKHTSVTHEPPPNFLANSQLSGPVPLLSIHPPVKAPPISQGLLPLNNPPPCLPENPPHKAKVPLSIQVPTSPKSTTVVTATTGNNGPWKLSPNSPTKTLLSIHPASQTRPPDNKQLTKAVSTSAKTEKLVTYGVVVSGYDSKVSEVCF
jgi:hypothetical protein